MEATLNGHRLLARPGDWRLWLLNAEAACLWDWRQSGLSGGAMAGRISHENGPDLTTARRQVRAVLTDWRQSGLLGQPVRADPSETEWRLVDPTSTTWLPGTVPLQLADQTLGLWLEPAFDAYYGADLLTMVQAACRHDDRQHAPSGPLLSLRGSIDDWVLYANDHVLEHGRGRDAALLAVLRELTEHACRAADRLLVVHGAGLVGPDGSGLLLIGPGGSGKTTLAAALNAQGWPLLHDDVVPVNLDGRLLGLALPLTLKVGSWPILHPLRPDLIETPILQRLGQPVRLLLPRGQPPAESIATGALIFPRYQPGTPAQLQRLSPEAALQGLIEAEAVIRCLTQDKLERLARWLESAPAWSLTYPDLASGLAGVRAIQPQAQAQARSG